MTRKLTGRVRFGMKVLGVFFLTAQGYPLVTPGNVPFFESRTMKDHNHLSLTPVLDYLSRSKDAEIDWTTSTPISKAQEFVKQAGIRSFEHGDLHTYYAHFSRQLRGSIQDYFARKNIRCPFGHIKIRYTSFDILRDLYEGTQWHAGDVMLIAAPTFGFYVSQAAKYGIKTKLLYADKNKGYKITPKQLDQALKETNARIFLLTNPVNPTGVFYTQGEVRALATVLLKHHVFTISDEIFSDIHFKDGEKPYSLGAIEGMAERTLTLGGVGKSMAVRLSFACSPVSHMAELPESGVLMPLQYAAVEALKDTRANRDYQQKNKRIYLSNIKLIQRLIEHMNIHLRACYGDSREDYVKIFIHPDSTNIILIAFPGIRGKKLAGKPVRTSLELADYIYNSARVATVPGEGFFLKGKDMVLRIPLSVSSKELEKGLTLILRSLMNDARTPKIEQIE